MSTTPTAAAGVPEVTSVPDGRGWCIYLGGEYLFGTGDAFFVSRVVERINRWLRVHWPAPREASDAGQAGEKKIECRQCVEMRAYLWRVSDELQELRQAIDAKGKLR